MKIEIDTNDFVIGADDFIGEDIPLTDKLNAIHCILDDLHRLGIEESADKSFINMMSTAKDWFFQFLTTFDCINGNTYNYIEERTFFK